MTELDNLAHELYCKPKRIPGVVYRDISYFIEHKSEFTEYYNKIIREIRKEKIKQLTEYIEK